MYDNTHRSVLQAVIHGSKSHYDAFNSEAGTSCQPLYGMSMICHDACRLVLQAVNDCSKTHSGPFNSETSGPVPASIQADARGGTGGRPTGLLVADFPYQ